MIMLRTLRRDISNYNEMQTLVRATLPGSLTPSLLSEPPTGGGLPEMTRCVTDRCLPLVCRVSCVCPGGGPGGEWVEAGARRRLPPARLLPHAPLRPRRCVAKPTPDLNPNP